MSSIPVMLTSHCDSHFERSHNSFDESKLDGVVFSSNGLDYRVRKSVQFENFYGFLQTVTTQQIKLKHSVSGSIFAIW